MNNANDKTPTHQVTAADAMHTLGEWPVQGAPKNETRLISNVVLMGMGEPLYNFDNVRDGMKIVSKPLHEGPQIKLAPHQFHSNFRLEIGVFFENLGDEVFELLHVTTQRTQHLG